MIERKQLRFPTILLQFLDSYFESELEQQRLVDTLGYLSISEQDFRDPNFSFDGEQFFLLLKMLRRSTVYEPPALRVLRYLSVSNMGMAGIAGITALTLNEAYNIAMKVYKLLMPAADLIPSESNGILQLKVELVTDFEDCNAVIVELILGCLKQFADEATGENLGLKLEFAHAPTWGEDEEKTRELYQNYFNCEVKFNADTSSIFINTEHLDKRLKNPNRILHSYATSVIDKEFQHSTGEPAFIDRVKDLLVEAIDNEEQLSLESLSIKLHMTPRTLSRKLAKENTQYKTLLNEVRFARAKSLIKQTDLPLKTVAAKLGFSSADAFSRAFKTYTGMTPNQWKLEG